MALPSEDTWCWRKRSRVWGQKLLLCLFESCSALTCRAHNLEVSPARRAPACWCFSSAPARRSPDLLLLRETLINTTMSRLDLLCCWVRWDNLRPGEARLFEEKPRRRQRACCGVRKTPGKSQQKLPFRAAQVQSDVP